MQNLLLIDTDPGVDDALALLMAYQHAAVVGLSIAAGNVGLAHTVTNALRLVELVGAETPVFAGCDTPLVLPAADAAFVHGVDGFGDAGLPLPERKAEAEHAALALIRLTQEQPGELTLVALGPLTNLALALRLDPTLPQRVPRLVVMGGAVTGRGNTSVPAEFNIGFDPESAHIVFSTWPQFELVDWEATMRHGIALQRFESWLAADDDRARCYERISQKIRGFMQERRRPGLVLADALAMAVALQPDCVIRAEHRHVAVELNGSLTRGATIVDWDGRNGLPANARIVLEVDQQRFEAMIVAALGAA
ncbi:purine nucleosidase [Tahibacter aquaticus]|uniref:Purine nucleosidase n=1 Tax=Tahibacter aquaticus TaxID=520092 RepID=A0A4R6YTS7_9GAMM|nr:nucleoside hydrolase [Tahibacter aquaticus]TDR41714.1 purine nucleosidase [Tahibacter aquaticus]